MNQNGIAKKVDSTKLTSQPIIGIALITAFTPYSLYLNCAYAKCRRLRLNAKDFYQIFGAVVPSSSIDFRSVFFRFLELADRVMWTSRTSFAVFDQATIRFLAIRVISLGN